MKRGTNEITATSQFLWKLQVYITLLYKVKEHILIWSRYCVCENVMTLGERTD